MSKIVNKAVIAIGGEAGYGIMSASDMIAKSMVLGGLNIYTRAEYPSLIRGGNNAVTIRVAEEEIGCSVQHIDLLLALNKETVDKYKKFLKKGSAIVYDSKHFQLNKASYKGIKLYDIPILKLIEELELPKVVMNTIIIGAGLGILDYDITLFEKSIKKAFAKKKKEVIQINLRAVRAGYNYVKHFFDDEFGIILKKIPKKGKKIILTGNDSLSIGAIKAGCKFLSAYPMTPASSIMTYFAKHETKAKVVMKQAFDEIGAINMALGASYAGVRSMTSTSGGGLALMTETVSLLGIQEIPLVIVNVQRPGPATGLPTRQGQGDLKFVLNIGHGDFPRIVMAPGDYQELFYDTFDLFNLAEKYQVPALILSDKTFASSKCSIDPFDMKGMKIKRTIMSDAECNKIKNYKRFANTKSGISKRAIPGQKCVFRSSSDDHNEFGEIFEGEENKIMMEDKRFRKMDGLLKELPLPKIYGPKTADITIVSWGSPKNAILEAMQMSKKKINFIQIKYMMPFHADYIGKFLNKAKKVICVEENKTGQLADIIRMNTGFKVHKKLLKYGGRSFFPEEILKGL